MTSNGSPEATDDAPQQFEERIEDFDAVVRRVAMALLEGTDPDDIQGGLVDALSETGLYDGIWVGHRLDGTATQAAGADPLVEVLGEIATLSDDTDGFVTRDEITMVSAPVVQAIAADRNTDLSGVRAARIPLRHHGLACGMAVVATRRHDGFEGAEREALTDIGHLAGSVLDAAVQRRLLGENGAIEAVLEARHTATPTAMTTLALRCNARVELVRMFPRDDSAHLFLTVATSDCSPSRLEDGDMIRQVTVRERGDDYCALEAVVSADCPLACLAASGVEITSAVADADEVRATIRAGETGPEILRAFRARFPNVRCVAKRQATSAKPGRGGDDVLNQADLTRKQRTVLEAALAGGFFQRPRDRTGAEIADSLEISASTFHQHLREAIRKVVETVFERST